MTMAKLLISVPEAIKAKLDAEQSRGTTASGLIRHLLEKHFNQASQQGPERAMSPKRESIMTKSDRNQENHVRRLAARRGYRVEKSRQQRHVDNKGEFMLIECRDNRLVLGEKYDALLDEIEAYLKDLPF